MIEKFDHFLRKHFLLLLCCAYSLAALAPQMGLALRKLQFCTVAFPDNSTVRVTASLLMLSFLLFNAGLGITVSELKGLWKRPVVIVSGFLANMLVPVVLILYLSGLMHMWHDADELQNLLVGLALIVAMPIAGASTAWTQNAGGNISLSLGLIFLSTMLSPLTTPMVLNIFSGMTMGDYSTDLHELASQGTNSFMALTVVAPSLLGMLCSFVLPKEFVKKLKPSLKLCNFMILLVLNYSNAATALPDVARHPDFDYLILIFGTALSLCIAAFFAGWLLSRALSTSKAECTSLMFGLGMNNNGTGLVLAGAALADHPLVLLPMIFYTLIQQIVAAVVDKLLAANTALEPSVVDVQEYKSKAGAC